MNRDLQDDLKKLADAFFDNIEFNGSWEYGSVGVDGKRPFGNSFVDGDILKIIQWEPENIDEDDYPEYSRTQIKYASELYTKKLVPYLKTQWKKHLVSLV